MFLFQPRSCQICLLQPSLHPQGATKKTSRLLGTMVVNNTNFSRYMSFRRCPKNSEILYRVPLCRDEIHAEIRQKSTNRMFFLSWLKWITAKLIEHFDRDEIPPCSPKIAAVCEENHTWHVAVGFMTSERRCLFTLPETNKQIRNGKFAGPEKEQKKYSNLSCYVSFREFIFLDGLI